MTRSGLVRAAATPLEHTTFIGRHVQIVNARAQLGRSRLLTVVGPGGVGKTRFAIRLANSVRQLYPDDVWFFDLSSVGREGSIADQIATKLGLPNRGRDEAAEVAAFFASSTGLMVLDSCEHVIDSAADLAARILRECPGMSIIATSRALLQLSAEVSFELGSLPIAADGVPRSASAVQLFIDRSASVLPNPSDADLRNIVAICERLDGIPLAIELAAGRAGVLDSRQILERLDAPLSLLTRADRDVPSRHQTLAATLAWSYDLCTEEERELWRLMSVFVGRWDIQSAERMMAAPPGSPEVLDTLESLLDKSIIQRHTDGGEAVYSMLDTVSAFGRQLSDPAELESARRRHLDWHLERQGAMEADWYGPRQVAWLRVGRRALPDIRAAVEFCLEERDAASAAALLVTAWRVVWQANGRFDELRRWGLRTLEVIEEPTPESCQLLMIIAGIESAQGDIRSNLARLDEADRIAERLGDPLTSGLAVGYRGYVETDPNAKVRLLERSVELIGDTRRFVARGDAVERLAAVHDLVGHTEIAMTMRSMLVQQAIRAGETFETSNLLMNVGINAIARREYENATTLLRQALSLKQDLDNPAGLAQTEEALASAAAIGNDFSRSATLLGSAGAIWDAVGSGVAAYSPLFPLRHGVEERARMVLGVRGFDAAYRRGQEFSIEDGVAYALGAPLPKAAVERSAGDLSPRESQVVALVGQGLTDREIAEKLVISRRTAEGHVARSLMKLGFDSRVQLATWVADGSERR